METCPARRNGTLCSHTRARVFPRLLRGTSLRIVFGFLIGVRGD